jgi:hypothetical protein
MRMTRRRQKLEEFLRQRNNTSDAKESGVCSTRHGNTVSNRGLAPATANGVEPAFLAFS